MSFQALYVQGYLSEYLPSPLLWKTGQEVMVVLAEAEGIGLSHEAFAVLRVHVLLVIIGRRAVRDHITVNRLEGWYWGRHRGGCEGGYGCGGTIKRPLAWYLYQRSDLLPRQSPPWHASLVEPRGPAATAIVNEHMAKERDNPTMRLIITYSCRYIGGSKRQEPRLGVPTPPAYISLPSAWALR